MNLERIIDYTNEAENDEHVLQEQQSEVLNTIAEATRNFKREDIEPRDRKKVHYSYTIVIYAYSLQNLIIGCKYDLLRKGKKGKITISDEIKEIISQEKQALVQAKQAQALEE